MALVYEEAKATIIEFINSKSKSKSNNSHMFNTTISKKSFEIELMQNKDCGDDNRDNSYSANYI